MVRVFNIFFCYLVGDLLLIGLSFYMGGYWLINTQVAFIATILIVYSSFFGYKKFIKEQSSFVEVDEDEDEQSEKFLDKSKKIIATFKGAFLPLRLLSYFLFVIAFLFLNRHGWFLPFAFLVGLSIVPIVTFIWGAAVKDI